MSKKQNSSNDSVPIRAAKSYPLTKPLPMPPPAPPAPPAAAPTPPAPPPPAPPKSSLVTRADVYDENQSLAYFPASAFTALVGLKRPDFLNLSGVDQLTDYALYALTQENASKYIGKVHLCGCCNITDQGVEWLTQNCPSITDINLNGCSKLTERSLHSILTHCPKVIYISMTGTKLGNIYLPEKFKEKKASIQAMGCPLLTPNREAIDYNNQSIMTGGEYLCDLRDKIEPCEVFKAVIVTSDGTQSLDFPAMLAGSESKPGIPYVTAKNSITLPDSNSVFNVIQSTQVLADMFVSERTVYILPFVFHESSWTLENEIQSVYNRMIHILCQQPHAVFGILPVLLDETQVNESDMYKIEALLKEGQKNLSDSVTKLLDTNEEWEFPDQERIAKILSLQEGYARVLDNDNRRIYLSSELFAVSREKAEKQQILQDLLSKCKEAVTETHQHLHKFSKPLMELFSTVQSDKRDLQTDSSFVGKLKTEYCEKIGEKYSLYWRALDYLNCLGHVIHIPTALIHSDATDEGFVTTNPEWFTQTLNEFLNQTSGAAQNDSNFDVRKCLQAALGNDQNKQEDLWLGVLKNAGILIGDNPTHIPILLPESAKKNPYFARHLGGEKGDHVEKLLFETTRVYNFHHPLPPMVMARLISNPTVQCKLAWRSGLVVQNIPTELMIRCEENRIEFNAQGPETDDPKQKESFLKMLEHEIQKHALVLEAILKSMGIAYHNLLTNAQPGTLGVMTGCKFTSGFHCAKCNSSAKETRLLWLQSKEDAGKTDDIVGNRIATSIKPSTYKFARKMDPVYFNELQIIVTSKKLTSVGIFSGETEFALKELEHGDEVTVKCVQSEDGSSHVIILMKNGEAIDKKTYLKLPEDPGEQPYIHTASIMGRYHIFVPKIPALSHAIKPQVGMRLEGRDKANPSLICVATVADVKEEEEQILIHFDGWTSRYDYWTSFDDPDLHPVGWFAQKNHVLHNLSRTLQPPKGRKTHNWNTYLLEVKNWPVPHSWFNAEQTNDCIPFDTSQIEHEFPGASGETETCTSNDARAEVWRKNRNKFISTNKDRPADANHVSVLIHFPQNLSQEMLETPCLELASKDLEMFRLCPYSTFPHLHSDSRSDLAMTNPQNMSNILIQPVRDLLYNQEFLPDAVSTIFPKLEGSKWTRREIQSKLLTFLTIILDVYLAKMANFKVPCVQTIENVKQRLGSTGKEINTEADLYCKAHKLTQANNSTTSEESMDFEDFAGYERFIDQFNVGQQIDHESLEAEVKPPSLTSLPVSFFKSFENITHFNVENQGIQELPDGLDHCKRLEVFNVHGNPLTNIPAGLSASANTLKSIDIGNTGLKQIPEGVFEAENLQTLIANELDLSILPAGIGKLTKLLFLNISSTALTSLPDELQNCALLQYLNVSGVPWTNKKVLSAEHNAVFFQRQPVLAAKYSKDEITELFKQFDTGSNGYLSEKEIESLNYHLFTEVPRFRPKDADDETGGFPSCIFQLTCLQELHMQYQGLTKMPEGIGYLKQLDKLDLSHNPTLESITPEIGTLESFARELSFFLKQLDKLDLSHNPTLDSITPEIGTLESFAHLNLNGCISLKTPPKEIVMKGFRSIIGYLRRLHMGSVSCKRTKLMLVGLGGAGKTSLVKKLTSSHYGHEEEQVITDGIDIVNWAVTHKGEEVTFSCWDFAGQSVYYNTHQFFLSNRAVYLLLWNIRLGYEHAGLDFWLSSIACHAPKAPILVVGTHVDMVQKYWLPKDEYLRQYPQIKGFHEISCYTNQGVQALRNNLMETTLQEKYMGEKIPEAWLNLETKMTQHKPNAKDAAANEVLDDDLVPWSSVTEYASQCGINEKSEVYQAVGFLHDLGAVQHFHNEFLRNLVVISPQWIVDAMACVVNVMDTPIKDGRLQYADLGRIWKDYPENMLTWLLRLTEEFDLTFPIPDEKCNIVPCLLPAEPPEYRWPSVEVTPGFRETKMVYKFHYLPAGLFNRVQVRLYQYSDSSVIWKKGSKLTKNGHHALMLQKNDKEVTVKVQGFRPENILFLIHEVFEGLISMSFHGVTYDYSIPCADCLKTGTQEPCMFSASKIRRATELKAPFLQCDKSFHTVTLTELHALTPPDRNSEFDLHLERSLHELDDLHDDLTNDIFMVYAKGDVPDYNEEGKRVAPQKIYDDLVANDYKVWFPTDPSNIDLERHAVTIRNTKLALICVSDAFVADQGLCDLFHYLRTNLQKQIQVVVLGNSFEWRKTNIGLLLSDDVFVNFQNLEKYQVKFTELADALRSKIDSDKFGGPAPFKCFISYCWANSKDAAQKGSRSPPGALGWGDPREFKEQIERAGISCWLDVERVGQGGLFEDIAEGLRKAKVVVACVSDEYAKSRNCQMEFRFANVTLDIPMVIAVVGTGYNWENTEVGMLSIGNSKVNCQHETKDAYERLISEVKAKLPPDDGADDASRTPSASDNSQIAFQELLELAQRKFQRQVATIADQMETSHTYPRLFVLDLLSEEEKGQINLNIAEQLVEDQEKAEAALKPKVVEQKENSDPNERPSSAVAKTLRPKSGGLRKRPSKLTGNQAAKAIVDIIADKNFDEVSTDMTLCVRFLCEHEQCWHVHGESLPLPVMSAQEYEGFLERVAPYMARILGILKHVSDDLSLFKTEIGEQLRKELESKCGTEGDFSDNYEDLRQTLIGLDTNLQRGDLKRCHLPSGKMLWLCNRHYSADERITVFNDDDDGDFTGNYLSDNITMKLPEITSKPQRKESTPLKQENSQVVSAKPKSEEPNKASTQNGVPSQNGASQEKPAAYERSERRQEASRKLQKRVSSVNANTAAKSAASGSGEKSKACNIV